MTICIYTFAKQDYRYIGYTYFEGATFELVKRAFATAAHSNANNPSYTQVSFSWEKVEPRNEFDHISARVNLINVRVFYQCNCCPAVSKFN